MKRLIDIMNADDGLRGPPFPANVRTAMNRFVLPPKTLPPLPPDDLPVEEVRYVVVDTETLGTSVMSRMVELAAVEIQGGRVTGQYGSLINPGCAIPPEATAVHGITDAMVRDQPVAGRVLPDLFARWEGAVIVAHNSPYDESILSTEAARSNLWIPPLPLLDTLKLARQLLEPHASYGLGALCASQGIDQQQAHRAMSDTLATAELFLRLLDRLRRAGTGRFADLCRVANLSRLGASARPLQDLPPRLILLRPGILSRSDVEIHYRKDGRTSILPGTLECGFTHGQHGYVELRDHRQPGRIRSLRVDHIVAMRPLAL
jgi:DNA polymerase III epsilon subunit family exonuclease